MKKLSKITKIGLIFLALGFLLLVIRGSEDDWICVDGEWVKHGVPSAPKPSEPCPFQKTQQETDEPINSEEKIIETKNGEEFLVTLESNPTTGYQWQTDFDSDYIELISSSYTPTSNESIVGAGGKDAFTFLAKKSGETQITFSYLRPWEKDTPPIKEEIYQITIE